MINDYDLDKMDAVDYLFLAGLNLTPIIDMTDIFYEKWFWQISAEERYCVIEQGLAEALIKIYEGRK